MQNHTAVPLGRGAPDGRLLGVLGGMGPLATAHFYQTIASLTAAQTDQQHLPVVIWADPRVPDRTDFLLGRGRSPVWMMAKGINALEQAGARAVAIPCNTAHAFLPELQAETPLKIVDMIRATVADAVKLHPDAKCIGILGTRGTRRARLYETAAAEIGLGVRHVSEHDQRTMVDEAIRLVKQGEPLDKAVQLIRAAAETLQRDGADIAIAACTEIPLITNQAAQVLPIMDSVTSLATACIREFGFEVAGL
ncbi:MULTISPECIES: aspartate/glutamate racemase family protein [unclassified Arthrobacter]|uniref:aspartate/glutamate racemase family protein n=1 Tax=unclassified Arthrobacter TaxID=235627 RepID=UPI001C611C29|nr:MULTISPECIES: amino acid racemase [unclassified Arthrobacter]